MNYVLTIILFYGVVIIFALVVTMIQVKLYKKTWMCDPEKNRDKMPEELRDSRPLVFESAEYENSLRELTEYNKRMVHRGHLFNYILILPLAATTLFLVLYGELFHGDAEVLFRTGVMGALWHACPFVIGIYIFAMLCIYEQFDFPSISSHIPWSWNIHNPKVFSRIIIPFLLQGTEAAWYYVRHRNDDARKLFRFLALILIPVYILFFHNYFTDTFKDLSNPPQSIQMQTEYSRLMYSEHYRMYVISCDDTLGNGYDFYLSKWEAEKMIKPLLPYFEYDEKAVNTWSEADTVLKEGKKLFLRNNPAEDGTAVLISMYPNTKSLCGFVLDQTDS